MALKYKIGDKVRIKSLDWYNKNKTSEGCLVCGESHINPEMICMLGKTVTISSVEGNHYRIKEYAWNWTDEMIEELVEEEMSLDKAGQITDFEYEGLAYTLPEGYQFVDENGNVINATKIVLEKKKKEYPKTYEECCKVLGLDDLINMHLSFMDGDAKIIASTNYHTKTLIELNCLTKLRICRDAYWKIAGEEMGLGKPWSPDWDAKDNHFYTIHTFNGKIECSATAHRNAVLIFPTAEMRDAFYENFKELIEKCKELL